MLYVVKIHISNRVYINFFFFHWHYSPLWALACQTMSLHFVLSLTNSLHLLTPSTWRSLSISLHPFLGRPLRFVPSSSCLKIFWASYPPIFSPGDPTNLSFAPLSILLYFLLYSSLLVYINYIQQFTQHVLTTNKNTPCYICF